MSRIKNLAVYGFINISRETTLDRLETTRKRPNDALFGANCVHFGV
jgi:hypothetical protein